MKRLTLLTGIVILAILAEGQSYKCDEYLTKSDSLLSISFYKVEDAKLYLKSYMICINTDNSTATTLKLKNLEHYDVLSLAKNKKYGWARNQNGDGEIGIIDSNYNWTKKLDCIGVGLFNNTNLCFVQGLNRLYGFFSATTGKMLLDFQFSTARKFCEGMALVSKDNKYGFINESGSITVPLQFDDASDFKNGYALVRLNGKTGCISKSGNVQIPLIYKYLFSFSEGRAIVSDGQKYGFIDLQNNQIVPLIYDIAEDFSEGYAVVSKDNKYGFINKEGKIVIPMIYDWARYFYEGKALVKYGESEYYINSKNEIIKNAN